MRLIREVPTSEIMQTMTRFLDENREGPNQPFFEYASEHHIWHDASLSEEALLALLPGLPACPASTAFEDAAKAAIERTRADEPRGYDHVLLDQDHEQQIATDLNTLVEQIEDGTPLLTPVADILNRAPLTPLRPVNLGDLHAWIDAVSGDVLRSGLPGDGYCDKHGEHCYHDSVAKDIAWEHVEYLAPGTRARVQGIVTRLTGAVPRVGAHDNGAARFSPEYAKTSGRTA